MQKVKEQNKYITIEEYVGGWRVIHKIPVLSIEEEKHAKEKIVRDLYKYFKYRQS